MADSPRKLSAKTRAVLELIAQGHSYEQILAVCPSLTYMDIFAAAKEALQADSSESQSDKRAYRMDEIRKTHARAYEKWTEEEEALLIKMYNEGTPVHGIAATLNRKIGAIESRLRKLGLSDAEGE